MRTIKIHEPKKYLQEEKVIFSAKISGFDDQLNLPKEIWYSLPNQYSDFLTENSDPFLLGILLPAMFFNYNIEIQGSITINLASKITAYQSLYSKKYASFNLIETHFNKTVTQLQNKEKKGAGLTFSGGVDSSYVLWSHLPENEPNSENHISHGIFVHGFDIFLYNQARYDKLYNQYQLAFENLGMQLIPLSTNLYSFTELRVPWIQAFNPPLISTGLILAPLFSKLYRAGEFIPNDQIYFQWKTDSLLSSETFEIIYYPKSMSRADKIEKMKEWGFLQENIRVCKNQKRKDTKMHCFRCGKCLNTLLYLDLLDCADSFAGFEKQRMTIGKLFIFSIVSSKFYLGSYENFRELAVKNKRWKIIFFYKLFALSNFFVNALYDIGKFILPKSWFQKIKNTVFSKNEEFKKYSIS